MKFPLTIRLESGRVIVSKDNGRTMTMTDSVSANKVTKFVSNIIEKDSFGHYDFTASAIGILSEAKKIRPIVKKHNFTSSNSMRSGQRISLHSLVRDESRALKEILDNRISERSFESMTLSDLATVLVRSSRIISWSDGPDGYQILHRPVPSAGARHPIDLRILALRVTGIEPGLWLFDSARCELVQSYVRANKLRKAVDKVKKSGTIDQDPAAIIFLVAQFARTLSRYPTGASLIWRDAGVEASTIHLCSTDIGLASCIIGTSQVLGYKRSKLESDVCAIAIGRKSA